MAHEPARNFEEAAIEDIAAVQRLRLDDFFTFMASRTDAFDEVDEFQAIRFRVRAELAERVFEQFVVDIGFAKAAGLNPDRVRMSPPEWVPAYGCQGRSKTGPLLPVEKWSTRFVSRSRSGWHRSRLRSRARRAISARHV